MNFLALRMQSFGSGVQRMRVFKFTFGLFVLTTLNSESCLGFGVGEDSESGLSEVEVSSPSALSAHPNPNAEARVFVQTPRTPGQQQQNGITQQAASGSSNSALQQSTSTTTTTTNLDEVETNIANIVPQQQFNNINRSFNRGFNGGSSGGHHGGHGSTFDEDDDYDYEDDYNDAPPQIFAVDAPLQRHNQRAQDPSYDQLKSLAQQLKDGEPANELDKLVSAEVEKILEKLNKGAKKNKGETITREELQSLPPEYQELIREIANSAAFSKQNGNTANLSANVNVPAPKVVPYAFNTDPRPAYPGTTANTVSNIFAPTNNVAAQKKPRKGVRTFSTDAINIFFENKKGGGIALVGSKSKPNPNAAGLPTAASLKSQASETLAKVMSAIKRQLSGEEDPNDEIQLAASGSRELAASHNPTGVSYKKPKTFLSWWTDILVAILTLIVLGLNSNVISDILKYFRKSPAPAPKPAEPSNVVRVEVWGNGYAPRQDKDHSGSALDDTKFIKRDSDK